MIFYWECSVTIRLKIEFSFQDSDWFLQDSLYFENYFKIFEYPDNFMYIKKGTNLLLFDWFNKITKFDDEN